MLTAVRLMAGDYAMRTVWCLVRGLLTGGLGQIGVFLSDDELRVERFALQADCIYDWVAASRAI